MNQHSGTALLSITDRSRIAALELLAGTRCSTAEFLSEHCHLRWGDSVEVRDVRSLPTEFVNPWAGMNDGDNASRQGVSPDQLVVGFYQQVFATLVAPVHY